MVVNIYRSFSDRVAKTRSLHGAIAAIITSLMLTIMSYMILTIAEDNSLIWIHSNKILGMLGAFLVMYLVIRLYDVCMLKLVHDWDLDPIENESSDDSKSFS